VESKKKNILKIDIKCPIIELPFSNNPTHKSFVDQAGKQSERWSIEIGDLTISNNEKDNLVSLRTQDL